MSNTASNTYRRTLLNPAHDVQREPLETERTPIHFASPYGRRISEYEQVLLYSQPNPDWIRGGIGVGGWSTRFPGGRGAWENYFTESRCTDWFAFRDPEGRWQKPYVAEKADEWRNAGRLFSTFNSRDLTRRADPVWIHTMIGDYLGALALHDYGLFMALNSAIRDCLVDTLRVAVVNWALDLLDSSQQIQAEKVYLGQAISESLAEVAPAKQLWLNSPDFAGARTFVEHLWRDGYDHIEVIFALGMIYEPLFGRFIRDEYFYRFAPTHGDQLTPQVIWPSLRSAEMAKIWIKELFGRILGSDPEFGSYNRQVMAWWARRWLPRTVEAVANISNVYGSTEVLKNAAVDSPRRIFEMLAEDWVNEFASVWGSDITVQDVLEIYDGCPTTVASSI
ncbi:ferritin family protein [Mycolicibacterium stellerae]|uniref:toluene hydroxylase n=1 Tax=Mycolicibacterium stellerae TaxID=2358193 RepID=UPI000F0BA814|nr:toluene hydroxylase [Mycolicibacterium stellerae]